MNADALDLTLQRDLPIAASGCQQAYGRIVSACQNTVTAIALAITRDVSASEDIAQEAFLRAWQQLAQLHNHASFLPWLRQITRNLARDWLRTQRHRPLSGEAAELAISMAADPGPSPSERMQRVEEELAAEELICALPEESRETLLLYYREGQSSQQVAHLLGLSDAAVRKRLSRARANVREQMLTRFGEFARSSAPGAAFAAAVVSAAMLVAPGVAGTTIAATTIGAGLSTASGASKLGGSLGVSALSGGTALGSLGAAMMARAGAIPPGAWLAVGLSLLIGFAMTYASGFYLLSYTQHEHERTQVRRVLRQMMLSAGVTSMATLVLSLLGAGPWGVLGTLGVGMTVVNYQCLVTLPRVMGPMLARDAARRGRTRPTWIYQSTFGRPAVFWSNVFVLGCAVWTLHVNGIV